MDNTVSGSERNDRAGFIIIPMQPDNWDEVKRIYLEGIESGQATFETEAPDWEQWDAGHLAQCRFVATEEEKVLGWAALSPVSRRKAYAGVAEVSVYISAGARGKGIGDALLKTLIEASEANGFWTLQASIFPENEPSVRLHLKHGFRQMGRRELIANHHGVWRDTLVLERRSRVIGKD